MKQFHSINISSFPREYIKMRERPFLCLSDGMLWSQRGLLYHLLPWQIQFSSSSWDVLTRKDWSKILGGKSLANIFFSGHAYIFPLLLISVLKVCGIGFTGFLWRSSQKHFHSGRLTLKVLPRALTSVQISWSSAVYTSEVCLDTLVAFSGIQKVFPMHIILMFSQFLPLSFPITSLKM